LAATIDVTEKRLRGVLEATEKQLDVLKGKVSSLMTVLSDHNPAEVRDRVMRSGVFRSWPDGRPGVDDIFWVLFCEDLRDRKRNPDPFEAARAALEALEQRKFIIERDQVYSLMRALASRRHPYFGIATDADLNVVVGKHPSGSARRRRPSDDEVQDARYFLFNMPLERDFRDKIRRLFWIQNEHILDALNADMKRHLKEQVQRMRGNFGLLIGKAAANCGFYANVAKGDLDEATGKNLVQFDDFTSERERYERRLTRDTQDALWRVVERW
jgi:hypothetical protein